MSALDHAVNSGRSKIPNPSHTRSVVTLSEIAIAVIQIHIPPSIETVSDMK